MDFTRSDIDGLLTEPLPLRGWPYVNYSKSLYPQA